MHYMRSPTLTRDLSVVSVLQANRYRVAFLPTNLPAIPSGPPCYTH